MKLTRRPGRHRARAGDAAPGSLGVVMGAVSVVDPDGVQARNRARVEVAMYVDVVGALDPTVREAGAVRVGPALALLARHVLPGLR